MTQARSFLRLALNGVLGLAAFAGCVGTVYARDVYKWTDTTGQIHYSDSKPLGQKWQRVEIDNISTIPTDVTPTPVRNNTQPEEESAKQAVVIAERAVAERREKLIQECEANRGVDCAQQVDTELVAQKIQTEGHVIHQARPAAAVAPTGTAR